MYVYGLINFMVSTLKKFGTTTSFRVVMASERLDQLVVRYVATAARKTLDLSIFRRNHHALLLLPTLGSTPCTLVGLGDVGDHLGSSRLCVVSLPRTVWAVLRWLMLLLAVLCA